MGNHCGQPRHLSTQSAKSIFMTVSVWAFSQMNFIISISKSEISFQKLTPCTDIGQVSQNYEIGCDCIFLIQLSGGFIRSLWWPIATLEMWNPSADCMFLILHLVIILTNLESLQSYFICSNCICSLITITITITILFTLTTILTPDALLCFLHPWCALPPSPRSSQFTNSQDEALSHSSSLLLTIFEFKSMQNNCD